VARRCDVEMKAACFTIRRIFKQFRLREAQTRSRELSCCRNSIGYQSGTKSGSLPRKGVVPRYCAVHGSMLLVELVQSALPVYASRA